MSPDERINRIDSEIEKHNEAIRGLIGVARTSLDSIQEMREIQRQNHERLKGNRQVTGSSVRHEREAKHPY
jgi:hypothetical protein